MNCKESCIFSGLFLALLVTLLVNGCSTPTALSDTEHNSKVWYCLGACAYGDSQLDHEQAVLATEKERKLAREIIKERKEEKSED